MPSPLNLVMESSTQLRMATQNVLSKSISKPFVNPQWVWEQLVWIRVFNVLYFHCTSITWLIHAMTGGGKVAKNISNRKKYCFHEIKGNDSKISTICLYSSPVLCTILAYSSLVKEFIVLISSPGNCLNSSGSLPILLQRGGNEGSSANGALLYCCYCFSVVLFNAEEQHLIPFGSWALALHTNVVSSLRWSASATAETSPAWVSSIACVVPPLPPHLILAHFMHGTFQT